MFSFRIISKLFAHYFRITFALFPRYFPSISELFSHYSVPAPKHPQVTTSNGGNARVFFYSLIYWFSIEWVCPKYFLIISKLFCSQRPMGETLVIFFVGNVQWGGNARIFFLALFMVVFSIDLVSIEYLFRVSLVFVSYLFSSS